MSVWITPITDRTQSDVTNRTNKGFLNTSDLNRIEGNIAFLLNTLRSFQHFEQRQVRTNWIMTDIPAVEDFVRIEDNLRFLERISRANIDVPDILAIITPNSTRRITYGYINRIEEVILHLHMAMTFMAQSYRFSGTFRSGEVTILPQLSLTNI